MLPCSFRSFFTTIAILSVLLVSCGPSQETVNISTVAESLATYRFIFPVKGVSVQDITKNIIDPRQDGWWVGNFFGHYCVTDCVDNIGYHPGEDWNMICKNGRNDCDEGEPVYAAGDGLVTYAQTYRDGSVGQAVVILHTLPAPQDLTPYILPQTKVTEAERIITQVETGYMHLKNITVRAGQNIKLGEKVGEIATFNGPHLHFEVRWKTGNLAYFSDYKPTHQALTDRGLLIPSAFIAAHTDAPFVFSAEDGSNPAQCTTEPTRDVMSGNIVCQKAQTVPLGATVWSTIRLDQIRKNTCFAEAFLKDNIYQFSSSSFCVTASDSALRDHFGFFVRTTPTGIGKWQVDYLAGENESSLKKIASSSLTVTSANLTAAPPPPRPIDQSFYAFAGIKLTCDRPLSKEAWGDYRCDGNHSVIPYGQAVHAMVKLHYLAPNVRYRFFHEIYHNDKLMGMLNDATWLSSGFFGLGEVYALPKVAPDTLGRPLEPGTVTIRTYIALEGKFTNWVTDQQIVLF